MREKRRERKSGYHQVYFKLAALRDAIYGLDSKIRQEKVSCAGQLPEENLPRYAPLHFKESTLNRYST